MTLFQFRCLFLAANCSLRYMWPPDSTGFLTTLLYLNAVCPSFTALVIVLLDTLTWPAVFIDNILYTLPIVHLFSTNYFFTHFTWPLESFLGRPTGRAEGFWTYGCLQLYTVLRAIPRLLATKEQECPSATMRRAAALIAGLCMMIVAKLTAGVM